MVSHDDGIVMICSMSPPRNIILTIISTFAYTNRVKLPSNNYTALMNAVAKVGPVGLALAAGTWVATKRVCLKQQTQLSTTQSPS